MVFIMNESITKINFEKAKEMLDENSQCILLDVREESEFCISHAEGAQCLPVDSIDNKTASLAIDSLDTPVIVYCKTGSRSELAAQRLSELGYRNIFDLGSVVGWPYGMGFGAY